MTELTKIAAIETTGEAIRIELVPLSQIEKLDEILWSKNSKKHDIDKILESIDRYGWVDPPKWDKNLNSGKGGIAFGNGRTEALITGLIAARAEGREPPRGIPVDKATGEWCIPIKFGVDCKSEVEAMALAIDHNNLQMAGFEDSEISRLWEAEGYLAVLSEIADAGVVPVTVDEKAIADMLESLQMPDDEDWDVAGEKIPQGEKIPFVEMTFTLHDEQKADVDRAMEIAKSMGEYIDSPNKNSNGNALARICEIFITQNER